MEDAWKDVITVIFTSVRNYCNVPTQLFIIGGKEIIFVKGTIQGDTTAMATYHLTLTSEIHLN